MGLTEESVKLVWMLGTEYAKNSGWIYTARFMSHALNGGGTSMNFDDDSTLVQTIKKSKYFDEHMKKVQDSYNGTGRGLTGGDKVVQFKLDDIPDLYYSLQHVTVDTHLLDDGRIYFTISDKYDFTQWRVWNKLTKDKGNPLYRKYEEITKGDIANDVGTLALELGVIHEFNINCNGYYGSKKQSAPTSSIEKFVSIAEEQVGYTEEVVDNNTKYGRWYEMNYEPWCAMFVSWCASQASILYSVVPRYCYCPYGVNDYEAVGRFRERWSGYIPKRGDVIFFQKNGLSCHTGIVTGVNGNTVYTVEGNTGDPNGGKLDVVARKSYDMSNSYILGYGVYSGGGSFSSVTMLRLGSKGEAVRNLQNLLISKGYSCGASGADGDFGQGTYNAVIAFQKANGLDPDGIVGPLTWAVLNGLGSSGNSTLLKVGSKGEAVRNLQNLLISKGYSCGASGADGDFGQGTYNAVVAFQKVNGLDADGVVGPATWAALNGSINCNSLLKIGNKGTEVVRLQNALISKGYSCGASGADGDLGQGTYNAVVEFQRVYGVDIDGIVGPATWNALSNIISNSQAMLRLGSKGDEVRKLQKLLISKG